MTEAGLHRWFRLLLRAYPRAYRRRHGDEIVSTLTDAAGSGRERPTAAEVCDVLAAGLRQRFRLPLGRLVVLGAALVAVTTGGLGAALGSAAAWLTTPAVPDDNVVRDLAALATGEPYRSAIRRDAGQLGLLPVATAVAPDPIAGWTPPAAEKRLADAGWGVDPLETRLSSYPDPVSGRVVTHMVAERDGVLLRISAEGPTDLLGETHALVFVEPATPASALPLAVAGGLVGLLAGWMLTARATYRLRRLRPSHRLPAPVLAAVAVAVLTPLTIDTYRVVFQAAVAAPDPVGYARFEIPPAFAFYAVDLSANWTAAIGLLAAMLAILLAATLRSAESQPWPRDALTSPPPQPS